MGVNRKRGTLAPDQVQTIGQTTTINSQSVVVTERNAAGKVTCCYGTVSVTDGGAGYAKGCFYVKTDGSGGTTLYINEGSTSSCDFNALQSANSGIAGSVQYAEVALTNAEMLALRATPKTLVAAPGAGKVLEFISAVILFDYTGAYTETADNMAVKYTDGSGAIVSETIEATGFVDATADTMTTAIAKADVIVAKSGSENKALVLHNTGDGEYGGGNAANAIRVKVAYRLHNTGF
jgi:hypothetical protein